MIQDETKILDFRNRTRNNPGTPARASIPPRYNNGGGGGNMDKYVTHQEFTSAMHQIDKQFDKLDSRFDLTDEKFNTINAKIDNLTKIMWWIMGLIAAGLIVPLLTFMAHAILNN